MSEDESHESSKAVSDSKDQVSNLQTETAVSDHAHDGKPSEESEDAATVEATATATNIHIGLGSNTSPAILTDTTKTEVPDDSKKSDTAKSKDNSSTRSRSATSTNTDLSGKWELNVSEDFKKDYDKYLQDLGQPALVRSVALSIIGMTAEEITQTNDGRELNIRGRNVRGNWERTLVTSTEDNPTIVPIVTADNEEVRSECWWEENSTVHRSWLRGVNKYGGGDFESKRYLDGDVLVCESVFHPKDKSKEKASVIWRFQKQN